MQVDACSIFRLDFQPPTWWEEITLVQLCHDELFSCVVQRFSGFGRSLRIILERRSQLELPDVVGRHARPEQPNRPFGEFSEARVFGENLRRSGTIFVYSDLSDPAKSLRGDVYLDVFDEIFHHFDPQEPLHAGVINSAEYFMPWDHLFSMGKVRVPVTGEVKDVFAWVSGGAKQKLVDVSYEASHLGPLVEIGRLFGGTAALMGLGVKHSKAANKVFSFDPYPHPYNERFLEIYGVRDEVALIDVSSTNAALYWRENKLPPIGLLHIDGDHRYDAVRRDIELWSPLVAPGGVIMFDDYGYNAFNLTGSTRAIYENVTSRSDIWCNFDIVDQSLSAVKSGGGLVEEKSL